MRRSNRDRVDLKEPSRRRPGPICLQARCSMSICSPANPTEPFTSARHLISRGGFGSTRKSSPPASPSATAFVSWCGLRFTNPWLLRFAARSSSRNRSETGRLTYRTRQSALDRPVCEPVGLTERRFSNPRAAAVALWAPAFAGVDDIAKRARRRDAVCPPGTPHSSGKPALRYPSSNTAKISAG